MRDPIATPIQRLTLEKARVAAMQEIGPQVAHDMRAEVLSDFISRNMVVRLQTEVMSHRDGTDEQIVWTGAPLLRKPWLLSVSAVLAGLGTAAFALGWYLLGAAGLAGAWLPVFIYLAFWPRPIAGRRPFRVRAERWTRFPENTMVFPRTLGNPVVQIMTTAEEADDWRLP